MAAPNKANSHRSEHANLPSEDGWVLVEQGSDNVLKKARKKADILRAAAELMQGKTGSVKVRKRSDQFSEERTYPRRNDPRRSPG